MTITWPQQPIALLAALPARQLLVGIRRTANPRSDRVEHKTVYHFAGRMRQVVASRFEDQQVGAYAGDKQPSCVRRHRRTLYIDEQVFDSEEKPRVTIVTAPIGNAVVFTMGSPGGGDSPSHCRRHFFMKASVAAACA